MSAWRAGARYRSRKGVARLRTRCITPAGTGKAKASALRATLPVPALRDKEQKEGAKAPSFLILIH